jgi:hypothetical protein
MDYMITDPQSEQVRGWFLGRLPEEWRTVPPVVTVDREEIMVLLHQPDVSLDDEAGETEVSSARSGRAAAFREETREARMAAAREAEHRFDRKVSWGVVVGDHRELWTHIAVPVMTRLRQPERQVLDTLIAGGVARSRSEALAWCVRLVEQHADDWLTELREALSHVAQVRTQGPDA